MKTIVESCADPSSSDVYRAGRAYVNAGLSFIPISADLTKMPAFELLPRVWCSERQEHRRRWSIYRERQPSRQELREWFLRGALAEYGMAILGGAISGNLEILDLDNFEIAKAFKRLIEDQTPGLFRRLVKVRTPRPGLHLYYRCAAVGGNQKLARIPDPDVAGKKPKTVIETKGEGGYCLAPPSPRECHPRQKCYVFIGGKDLTQVPMITPEERAALFDAARTFDAWKDQRRPTRRHRRKTGRRATSRPGDDFNQRADWADILEPHGWTYVGDDGGDVEYWRRPGKAEGVSATTNYADSDLLYVFSSNADPFEDDTAYTKFAAYALLEHDGDFSDAARELGGLGYGRTSLRSRCRVQTVESRYARRALRSRRR
jgi:hypothetical protein